MRQLEIRRALMAANDNRRDRRAVVVVLPEDGPTEARPFCVPADTIVVERRLRETY
ncbi:MAG TPA: hypothetical protein VGN97_23895 [Mesorhizobium sp.]|jgi:hypothetical protein|nr:hypothetical protein [Mesorhizobium sp.]